MKGPAMLIILAGVVLAAVLAALLDL